MEQSHPEQVRDLNSSHKPPTSGATLLFEMSLRVTGVEPPKSGATLLSEKSLLLKAMQPVLYLVHLSE